MSLKDDVSFVKESLSGDEKVLESAFKLETLYNKHKIKIFGIVIIVVGFFAVQAGMNAIHEGKLAKANDAFLALQANSEDAKALSVLKENNPSLFELYSYSQAVKKQDNQALVALITSKNTIIADMSAYAVGVMNKKPIDSKLYQEMSDFQSAYLAMTKGDKKSAKAKLELIGERSSLAVISGFMKHSLIKED